MTETEMQEIYYGMLNYYGNRVPDPDVLPKVFAYYLKLYRYYHYKK